MDDVPLALLFLVFGALLWRNPKTHFPKAYRLIKEKVFAGPYWAFPILSVIFLAGAVFLIVRALM